LRPLVTERGKWRWRKSCLFCAIASGALRGANRVAEFPHSVAVLHFNQLHRGRSILIAKQHCIDMLDLDDAVYAAIGRELRQLGRALRRALRCRRINYANFGNVTPHLHWHVFPRYPDDPKWGGPPKFNAERSWPDDERYAELAQSIRAAIVG
jgi:diadenosine tetraphosphate (Ap4A) HIT family hydrolase